MTTQISQEVIGITFPILPEHVPRFFKDGKHVFVKFIGMDHVPPKLRHGSKLFFYESGGNKEIVGEAKIVSMKSVPAINVMSLYGDGLFLNEIEFKKYVGARTDKPMLVLVLTNAKQYSIPLKLAKPITKAGQYMMREMYLRLLEDSKK